MTLNLPNLERLCRELENNCQLITSNIYALLSIIRFKGIFQGQSYFFAGLWTLFNLITTFVNVSYQPLSFPATQFPVKILLYKTKKRQNSRTECSLTASLKIEKKDVVWHDRLSWIQILDMLKLQQKEFALSRFVNCLLGVCGFWEVTRLLKSLLTYKSVVRRFWISWVRVLKNGKKLI